MFLLLLIGICVANLVCSPEETYFKISKYNGASQAEKESHKIFLGSELLIESPKNVNDTLIIKEYCVQSSPTGEYMISLIRNDGDGWYGGSWIRVENLYNSISFQRFMERKTSENYTMIQYQPIKKADKWKHSSSFHDGWTSVEFDDSEWETVSNHLNSLENSIEYYRRVFDIHATDPAAFEVRVKHTGLATLFVNSHMIYHNKDAVRRNGGYSSDGYYAVIRNGRILQPRSVLCVSVERDLTNDVNEHAGDRTLEFDAWLAVYGSSSLKKYNNNCYYVGYPLADVEASPSSLNPQYALNMNYTDQWYLRMDTTMMNEKKFFQFSFDNDEILNVELNGFAIWMYDCPEHGPKDFEVFGLSNDSTPTILSAVRSLSHPYRSYSYAILPTINQSFNQYYLNFSNGHSPFLQIFELQPLICNVPLVTDTFEYDSLISSLMSQVTQLNAKPTILGLSQCSVSPPLPSGLVVNSFDCVISGTPHVITPPTLYTITASIPHHMESSFEMEVVVCNGTVLETIRVYSSSPELESYNITSLDDGTVLYSEKKGEVEMSTVIQHFCFDHHHHFLLTMKVKEEEYWANGSFIEILELLEYPDKEPLVRGHLDNRLGTVNAIEFGTLRPLPLLSWWKYKMAYAEPDWYWTSTDGWSSARRGSFQQSSNQYQVYRRVFEVSEAEYINSSAASISLRYTHGCLVYLNGQFVFGNRLSNVLPLKGQIARGYYSEVMYRTIVIPLITPKFEGHASKQYVRVGNNEIAIALVSNSTLPSEAVFDCSIRMLGTTQSDRTFALSVTGVNITGEVSRFYEKDSAFGVNGRSSDEFNQILFSFDHERFEWINSITLVGSYFKLESSPVSFEVVATSCNPFIPTTIAVESNWKWWHKGQWKKFYLHNALFVCGIGIRHVAGSENAWSLNQIVLSNERIHEPYDPLIYKPSYSWIRDVDVGEVFPESKYPLQYSAFSIDPALPLHMAFDSQSGTLLGTPSVLVVDKVFTVHSMSKMGEAVSTEFRVTVVPCTNGSSLISLNIHIPTQASLTGFTLFKGRGESGGIVVKKEALNVEQHTYRFNYCLEHSLYTVSLTHGLHYGWSFPGSYYISIDDDSLVASYDTMPIIPNPAKVSTTFSSYLPIESEFTVWKRYNSSQPYPPSSDWIQLQYDDSEWLSQKCEELGKSEPITLYLRKEILIPDLMDYLTMNMYIRYEGGFAAYFNGHRVARYNLPLPFDHNTLSILKHSYQRAYRFSFGLYENEAVVGANILCIEIHRDKWTHPHSDVNIRASAMFGVESCNILANSFVVHYENSTQPVSGDLHNLFDGLPTTTATLLHQNHTSLVWTAENLDGIQFHSFVSNARKNYRFIRLSHRSTLMGEMWDSDEWLTVFVNNATYWNERVKSQWSSLSGTTPSLGFQWTIERSGLPDENISLSEISLLYCNITLPMCKGIGSYAPVPSNRSSVIPCSYGYKGMRYRQCIDGVFGDEQTHLCEMLPPHHMHYINDTVVVYVNHTVIIPPPTYENIIQYFTYDPKHVLPEGFVLDVLSGTIIASPLKPILPHDVVIIGKNEVGETTTTLQVSAIECMCPADGVFPSSPCDTWVEYDCRHLSSFGTIRRYCQVATWYAPIGACTPWFSVGIIVVAVLLAIVVFVVYIYRLKKAKQSDTHEKSNIHQDKTPLIVPEM